MTKIYVASRNNVAKRAKQNNATHIVSIIDPFKSPPYYLPNLQPQNYLCLKFIDNNFEGPDSPQQSHIDRLLTFCKTLTTDSVCVVHCEAGMSRSTATALAFYVYHNGFDGAVENILRDSPQAIPNLLMSEMFDKSLDFDGKLLGMAYKINELTYEKVARII